MSKPIYSVTLSADLLTPVAAFLLLRQEGQYGFLMESAAGGERFGRFSYLGINPLRELYSSQPNCANWSNQVNENARSLSECLASYISASSNSPSRRSQFSGGLVGFIGFDFVREIEKFAQPQATREPVAWLGDYQTSIVFDHLKQELTVSTLLERGGEQEVHRIQKLLSRSLESNHSRLNSGSRDSTFTKSDFCDAVNSFKRHIVAGDIFQGVLSQRFHRPCEGDPFELYRALRRVNPSPYMFYQETPVGTFVGASPELLVGVQQRKVRLLPIAGTRPRAEDDAEDLKNEQALLADPKERAEHMMLVDLARNDLGRVAQYGSVSVDETAVVHRFSHVMHMVSSVSANLRDGITAVDALRASFPAGTVSGAPKVRALELILAHEPTPRGFYAGAGGFLTSAGDAEFCITLRTARIHNGVVEYQAGAGIVADSNPEAEYDETLFKARAIERALDMAGQS